MIKTQYCVPEILYRDSRDFQLLGRVFDVVFNFLKSNSELVATNPLSDNMDERLLTLLAATVGLQTPHNYNNAQLRATCSAFASMLRTKGTRRGLELATNALLGAEGISKGARVEFDPQQGVKVFLPTEMQDVTLLNDLLDYLIPAGVGCEVVREAAVEVRSRTNIGYGTDTLGVSEPAGTWETSVVKNGEMPSFEPLVEVPGNLEGKIYNTTVVGKKRKETSDSNN